MDEWTREALSSFTRGDLRHFINILKRDIGIDWIECVPTQQRLWWAGFYVWTEEDDIKDGMEGAVERKGEMSIIALLAIAKKDDDIDRFMAILIFGILFPYVESGRISRGVRPSHGSWILMNRVMASYKGFMSAMERLYTWTFPFADDGVLFSEYNNGESLKDAIRFVYDTLVYAKEKGTEGRKLFYRINSLRMEN